MSSIPKEVKDRLDVLSSHPGAIQNPNFAVGDLAYHEPADSGAGGIRGYWSYEDSEFEVRLVGQLSANQTFLGDYGDMVRLPDQVELHRAHTSPQMFHKEKARYVEFSLLGASNKVVTNTQRFEFIQTEAVSDKVLPRTVVIALSDGERPISNEQTLTFDSASQLLDERKKSVFLTVLAGTYDKTRDYWLTARDVTTKVEVLRVPLRVDLAFTNDF